uniref:MEG-2 (ESP15) family n=1 Tax=Schistosoma mansoni TaxID=6183 RepID=C4QG05_SCHMA
MFSMINHIVNLKSELPFLCFTETTCCDEDGNSKICCVGNDCKDVIKPRSSGADDLNLFLRKRGMAYKLGEILKKLN